MCLCLKRSLPHHIVLYIGGIKLSVCLSVNIADAPHPPAVTLNMADTPHITLNMANAPALPPVALNIWLSHINPSTELEHDSFNVLFN